MRNHRGQTLPKVVVYRKTWPGGHQTNEQGYECMADGCRSVLEYRFDPAHHSPPWRCEDHADA